MEETGVWQRLLDRLFPVEIEEKPDALVIEDRRPGDGFVVSVTIAALSLAQHRAPAGRVARRLELLGRGADGRRDCQISQAAAAGDGHL